MSNDKYSEGIKHPPWLHHLLNFGLTLFKRIKIKTQKYDF